MAEAPDPRDAPPDPFGRAIRDFSSGEQDDPLRQCGDGSGRDREHPVEALYFDEFDPDSADGAWLLDHLGLGGPLLDMGAGAGRHSLHLQERTGTVAIDPSEHLVATMRERGVHDTRVGDMFALTDQFDRDRFRSALAVGTQVGLAGSMDGLRTFLVDLARVTDPGGRAVLDCYDPDAEGVSDLLGFRDDPAPGLAHRVVHFEYESDVGPTLCFRLFGPERFREACAVTPWTVADVRYGDEGVHYRAALVKR